MVDVHVHILYDGYVVGNTNTQIPDIDMLFSKMTNNNVKTLTILYYPQHGAFGFIESHVPPHRGRKIGTASAVTVCSYRYPSGEYGLEWVRENILNKTMCVPSGDVDGLCFPSRDLVWELYANWRRAFASGYDCSEIFNIHGIDLPNPMIAASHHMTFDIRLGACIVADRRARALIGSGGSRFLPHVH